MSTTLPSELFSYKMWVLVPHLETDDPNLKYYYDFSQSYQEYTRVFTELKMDWAWQPVSMDSITETIHTIKNQASGRKPLVINLCDGDEVNGCPGVSVIDEDEMERMTRGEFDARLPVESRDEFGDLAAGVNRMAAHLQDLYQTLEGRVAAKTHTGTLVR